MRLLNSITHKLETFDDNQIPEYAILSHTWGDDEPSFQDMQQGLMLSKAGYKKVEYACSQAADEGWLHIWVDTICIDKSSSAELSEAINSMFRWYQKAEICYAYLSDVPALEDVGAKESAFARSRWFTRGWTLQELIAPSDVVFYSGDWTRLGSRTELRKAIWETTQISSDVFEGARLSDFSVAQRMSWASKRRTKRIEDMAYCLLGIFDVNMALLYGEGVRSFTRLQEQIMTASDDQSLFAWKADDSDIFVGKERGLLATSPAEFQNSSTIVPYRDADPTSIPYSVTNKGIRITLKLARPMIEPYTKQNLKIGIIGCGRLATLDRPIGILLLAHSSIGDQYCRVYPHALVQVNMMSLAIRGTDIRTIYVCEKKSVLDDDQDEQKRFQIRPVLPAAHKADFVLSKLVTEMEASTINLEGHSTETVVDIPKHTDGWIAALVFKQSGWMKPYIFTVMLGYTPDLGASIRIEKYPDDGNVKSLFGNADPRDPSVLEAIVEHKSGTFVVQVLPTVIRESPRSEGPVKLDIATLAPILARKIYALDIQIHDALWYLLHQPLRTMRTIQENIY